MYAALAYMHPLLDQNSRALSLMNRIREFGGG